MKVISFIVPCYNAQNYMEKCLDSLLIGDESIEILVINDGSTDETALIANKYEKEFPSKVRFIHQENAGHGGAVNTGIKEATGLYVKVVDSDDWVNSLAYSQWLTFLKETVVNPIDMVITNYVYDKVGVTRKKVMEYSKYLSTNETFGWEQVNFPLGKYLMMHSITYRTQLLRDIQLELPTHTFYVDNLYVFQPLSHVQKMTYLDVNLYHYFIGREDQSVNERLMIKRIDQQLKVNKLLIDHYARVDNEIKEKNLRKYMNQHLEITTAISSILLLKDGTPISLEKKGNLWNYLRERNLKLHQTLKKRFFGRIVHLQGQSGRKFTLLVYRMAHKVYGFN